MHIRHKCSNYDCQPKYHPMKYFVSIKLEKHKSIQFVLYYRGYPNQHPSKAYVLRIMAKVRINVTITKHKTRTTLQDLIAKRTTPNGFTKQTKPNGISDHKMLIGTHKTPG